MKFLNSLVITAALLSPLASIAQSRDVILNVEVSSVPGDNLQGQTFNVTQTDFAVSYGTQKLDKDGKCTVKIYPGNHSLQLDREGFETFYCEFTAESGTTIELPVQLMERTRKPYALQATPIHDARTGRNDISLVWNTEKPAFFDDFESYDPFSITFGDWTGIDGDGETTAPLLGNYPNRGGLQYAQIINPLTVNPTWWYDYPVLRPYAGQQYIGFIRTSSGAANDDWLISPEITLGTGNILSFMAKAADQYPERFMVYITENTDNPTVDDFERLDNGNYESVDYKTWTKFEYDLSALEGKKIKFAIRYIGDASRFGSFMLMLDDVFVGQSSAAQQMSKAKRIHRSAANPNETFEIYLDGNKLAETDEYTCILPNVEAGTHTVGVRAVYLNASSEMTEITVNSGADTYAVFTINVSSDSKLNPEGTTVTILSHTDAGEYTQQVTDGIVQWNSLPVGKYDINVEEGAYAEYRATVDVDGDMTHNMVLEDNILTPYNITATPDEEGNIRLRWNQSIIYTDSFEDYEDFATGEFGDWLTLDCDHQPVYPIGLGSTTNIVSFPGSGTATNPVPVAPMVFNPWETVPAMLPTDEAIAAPTGDKSIIFFSPQRTKADKWLISPLQEIREGFEVSFYAKAYSFYPESMQICVSDGSQNPADFEVIAEIDEMVSQAWGLYAVSLEDYVGKNIRIGLHYTSIDAFLAQVDDFTVGPENGEGEAIVYGNVENYEVYLDNTLIGETIESSYLLPGAATGKHTADIYAIYRNGRSDKGTITFGESGIESVSFEKDACEAEYFDMLGRRVSGSGAKGVYIRMLDGKASKVVL